MKNFNRFVVSFYSLLLMLICFTSCEQQETLTDAVSDVSPLELLVSTSEVPDHSTIPADLSVPVRTLDNTSSLEERSPCVVFPGSWKSSQNLGWVWLYTEYKTSNASGAWAYSNRHQAQIYLYPGQQFCGTGLAYYTNSSIGGYTGAFWDNSRNDNSVYSYSAQRWIQY